MKIRRVTHTHSPAAPRRAVLRQTAGILIAALLGSVLVVIAPQAAVATPTAAINASPSIPQDDVIVYTQNVLDFGADKTGANDSTAAFQAAIDAAYADGGGIVYAPAGLYKFTGHLIIDRKVTLRGEWRNPDADPHWAGTILMPYADRGSANGTAFIGIASSAGVKNLNVWYPEQTVGAIQPYPYTISDVEFDAGAQGTHAISVQNVTFYNSYQGIRTGSTVGFSQEPRLANVYGTFLKEGITLTATTNFGGATNLSASSKYWINSGVTGAPSSAADQTTLKTYLRANLIAVQTLMRDGHHDGFSIYGITVEDANVGLHGSGFWDFYSNITMANVNTGVIIDGSGSLESASSQQLIGGTINVLPGADHYGIVIPNLSQVDIVGMTIGGSPDAGVYGYGGARLNIMQSTFTAWANYAVKASGSSLQVNDSHFGQAGTGILLSPSIGSAALLGNTWTGGRIIENRSVGLVKVDDAALNLPQMPNLNAIYSPIPLRKPAGPGNFYDITTYGATRGGTVDSTAPIQNALDAAAAAGGGTVFVPAGYWLVNGTLTIPQGVHLRGVAESVGIGDNYGSVLFPTSGKNNASGTPFITMNANSGLQGVTFYYPEMASSRTTPYPWTVRANGSNVYIRNVSLGNAWQGVDLFTNRNDNFELSGVWGNPRETGVKVGGGSVGGKLENTMFTFTGDFNETQALSFPGAYYGQNPDIRTTRSPLVFANSTGVKGLQNSVFAPDPAGEEAGVTLVNEGGVANDLTLIQSATDQAYGFLAKAAGTVNFIGLSSTWAGSQTESTFTGTVNVFGYNVPTLDGASPLGGSHLDDNVIWNRGGTVNVIGCSVTFRPYNAGFRFDAGTTVVAGLTMTNTTRLHHLITAGPGIISAKVIGSASFGPITAVNSAGRKLQLLGNIDTGSDPSIYPAGWAFAAIADQPFAIAGTTDLAYGAAGTYATKTGQSGTVTFDYPTWGDPIVGQYKIGYFKAPPGYTWVGMANDSYTITGTADVAYGTGNQFAYLSAQSGTIVFDNTTFGDPAPGFYKAAFVKLSNLALGKIPIATSTHIGDNWSLARLTDGIRSSSGSSNGWSSESNLHSNHSEVVAIDLGSSKPISNINLVAALRFFPIDYKVQIGASSSGPWTTVATVTGAAERPNGASVSHGFATQNARWVRIEATNLRLNSNDYRFQLAEIEVF